MIAHRMIARRTIQRYQWLILGFFLFLFSSCVFLQAPWGLGETATAVLWTDRPEFALYAANFNNSQNRYKIEVRYFESLAQKLTDTTEYPDIAVGSWLKSISTRTLFRPLDDFFKNKSLDPNAFYSQILALGRIEDKQYLFPVSFNLPALVVSRENSGLLSNLFITSLEEIKAFGKEYNRKTNGSFSRMGFSPSWNNDFLFVTATLFNTSFREASPLAWDPQALEAAILYIRDWIQEVNDGIDAEDDFIFKYFYDPPSKLTIAGRILFTYMDSSEFFTLSEEQRSSLDFRWIAENDTIPLLEDTTYFGICKAGKARKASRAFTQWFFQEETQRNFMEKSRANRLNETLFGIGHGFSALKTVTEQIFPQYYPGLLGHVPPETFLLSPNILPGNWMAIKDRVILPYLHDRIRSPSQTEVRSLERNLADWLRINRGS